MPLAFNQPLIVSISVKMLLLQKSASVFLLLALVDCGLSDHLPINYNNRFGYAVPIVSIPPHLIVHDNRVVELSDIFSPEAWLDTLFPIEINVPDTVMSAYDSFESAWSAASDYFSMGEEGTSRYPAKFTNIYHIN